MQLIRKFFYYSVTETLGLIFILPMHSKTIIPPTPPTPTNSSPKYATPYYSIVIDWGPSVLPLLASVVEAFVEV